jgi:hypothetical protein
MGLADYYGVGGGAPRKVTLPARSTRPLAPLRRQERKSSGGRSIMGQIGDTLKALPAGIGHLAQGAGMFAAAPVRMARDIATGDTEHLAQIANASFNPREGLGMLADVATGRDSERSAAYREYAGLPAEMIDSLENTAMRIRHPSRYADAVEESGIVGALLEDAGNIALVGGPVGKGLTAAGLPRVGGAVSQVAGLGNAVGDAPFSLPRRAVNAGGRGILDRALPKLVDASPAVARAVDNAPQFLTREGRQMRSLVAQGARTADRSSARIGREIKRVTERNNISPIEQEAAAAIIRGQADLFRTLRDQTGRPVAELADIAQPDKLPESYTTPEAAELAVAIVEGTADPALMERLAPFMDELRVQRDRQTERALAGEGRDSTLMDEQVTSDAPLSVAVAQAADEGMPVNLDDPMTYAARHRPIMAQARAVEAATGMPVSMRPEQMTAAGITPEYLPGGKSRAAMNEGSRVRNRLANEGQTVFGDQKLSDEYMRGADAIGPTSAAGLTDKLMQAEKQAIQNDTYRELLGRHGRDYKAVINDVLPDIEARAKQSAELAHADPKRQAGRYVEDRGQAIIEAMAERGFEPWPVKGRVDAPIKAADIDQAAWLPAGMRKTLVPYWNPKPPGVVLRALEKTNAKFKGAVLPFSIRWQLGDAISNMMMAGMAGGVDPITMFARMRDAKKLMDTPEGARLLDQSIPESGLFFDEQEWLRGPFKTKAERRDLPVLGQRRPVRAVQQGSYRLNEFTNRIQRQGFFLEKLDRQLREKGINLDNIGEAGAQLDDPKIQAAIEKAVKDTAFVLGDMSNLSPFERRVMRQVMPFYPWMRHVSKLASGLAIDHPARLVFMMRVGSLAASGDMDDLPPFLQGSVEGPGGWWQTSFMNPLADVEALPALSPQGALRSLAPGIKLTASALTGGDLNRGGLQLTRPADTGNRDWYGRDAINPLIFDPGGLAYQASRTIPLTREAWNQTFGPDARFGTGETITNKYGKSIDPGNRWESLPRLVGMPMPFKDEDVKKIQAQRAERLRAQAKAER